MKQYDETKLNFRAKWIIDYTLELEQERQKEIEKLKAAASFEHKIQKFKSYLYSTYEFNWIERKVGSFGLDRRFTKANLYWTDSYELDETKEKLEELKAKDIEIYKENLEIQKKNKEAYNKIIEIIKLIGIETRCRDEKSRKSIKPYIDCPFVTDLANKCHFHAPRDPSYDWDNMIKKLEAQNQKKYAAEKARVQEKEKQERESAKTKLFVDLIKKYNLDFPSGLPSADDMLEAVIRKNKYLYLAHYLLENRNDWNDGCYYAKTGLNGFKVEDEVDKMIYADISSYINDWDGDGRCFRDCAWNYDRLFSMVDADLYKDYVEVEQYVNKY